MIDTHCHLDDPVFGTDRDALVHAARAAGVSDVVVPGIGPHNWDAVRALAAERPGVHAAFGVHPQLLAEVDPADDDRMLAELEAALDRGAVAVGECGLDAPTAARGASLDRQLAVLRGHLELARRFELPVVLHVFHAHEPLAALLAREPLPAGGVLHSFSGSAEQVRQLLRFGLHYSFAGPVTYAQARKPVEAVRAVPPELLLLETDAPDQTPRPHRGRCEPAHLADVARAVADALSMPLAELDALTSANARRLFRLPSGAPAR
ncbi:MAG TPA: TatD family hydrolase [Anaeromyxobacteraceae bacterium]|nr:TatD family hydrolase [Anaeromyxobacteraceae bacterium]